MKHIICFSGGKDSQRLLVWAKEHLGQPGVDWIPAHWMTGWENPITDAHIEYVNQEFLGGTLVRRASKAYPGGFKQLVVERNGFPSHTRRFCTSELKVKVQHEFIEELNDDVTVYIGIRKDESEKRRTMQARVWLEDAGGYWVERPILEETAEECFGHISRVGMKCNPLYLMGVTRIGCWPCIEIGVREFKQMLHISPQLRVDLPELEKFVNENVANRETRKWLATFFPAGTIPDRFCSLRGVVECRKCDGSGKTKKKTTLPLLSIESADDEVTCGTCDGLGEYEAFVPTAQDVIRYVDSTDENQMPIILPRSCMSVYNLCE